MIQSFTVEIFSGRLGQSFVMHPDDGPRLETELIEVNPLGNPRAGRRAPFSIVLRSRANVVLPQRIYRLEHAELGQFELFLVPIGPDEAGMRYEAVFT